MATPNMMLTTKRGGIGHILPIWDGSDACRDISERNGGVLYIKAIGGHINWNALGRKDMVRAYHQDHHFSIYDPIFRDLNYFPGPLSGRLAGLALGRAPLVIPTWGGPNPQREHPAGPATAAGPAAAAAGPAVGAAAAAAAARPAAGPAAGAGVAAAAAAGPAAAAETAAAANTRIRRREEDNKRIREEEKKRRREYEKKRRRGD